MSIRPPFLRSGLTLLLAVITAFTLIPTGSARAVTFSDGFSTGVDPLYWEVTLAPLFTLDDTQGDVRLAKSLGGDHSLQRALVRYRGILEGDFDVSLAFHDASIEQMDGLPGNQVQLNAHFGSQYMAIVRSDEPPGGGQNHHVYRSPPGTWVGTQASTATAGIFRLRRTGTLVEAFVDGALLHSANYNTDPLDELSFSLQANGTNDSISVIFDDFAFTADTVTAVDPFLAAAGLTVGVPSPNPTGSWSRLSFDLTRPIAMSVSVYDVRGRLVRQLLRGTVPLGPHTLAWDGRDEQGRSVAAGIYHYRIQAGEYADTKRVVILR